MQRYWSSILARSRHAGSRIGVNKRCTTLRARDSAAAGGDSFTIAAPQRNITLSEYHFESNFAKMIASASLRLHAHLGRRPD